MGIKLLSFSLLLSFMSHWLQWVEGLLHISRSQSWRVAFISEGCLWLVLPHPVLVSRSYPIIYRVFPRLMLLRTRNAVLLMLFRAHNAVLCFYYNAVVSTQCCAFINAVANTQYCAFINAVGSTQCWALNSIASTRCCAYNAVVSIQCCAFIDAVASTQCCALNAVGST